MQSPNVVVLSNDEPETAVLRQILSEHAVVTTVNDLAELFSVLERGEYDALFCGWSFYAGTWNAALDRLRERAPELPVIVFCRVGGEEDWVNVLETGAFDLLALPYRKETVIPMLEHAVASHEARLLHSVAFEKRGFANRE